MDQAGIQHRIAHCPQCLVADQALPAYAYRLDQPLLAHQRLGSLAVRCTASQLDFSSSRVFVLVRPRLSFTRLLTLGSWLLALAGSGQVVSLYRIGLAWSNCDGLIH